MRRRDKGQGRDTTVARFELAQANEGLVVAEGALRGERRVAIIRLAVLVLMAVSQGGIAEVTNEPYRPDMDQVLRGALIAYALFAIVAFFVLRAEKPHAQRARWLPLPTTLFDTGFYSFMAWHGWVHTGLFDSGMLAASLGMVLAFSVARFSWLHVLLSTVLSSTAYSLLAGLTGHGSPARVSFVVFCYVSESTWRKGGDRFAGERLGETHVKGRREAVVVYALDGRLSADEVSSVRAAGS